MLDVGNAGVGVIFSFFIVFGIDWNVFCRIFVFIEVYGWRDRSVLCVR